MGDYVQPYGAIRNQSAIVLSPEAQSLDIRPYWFTFIATNQFSRKSHEDSHSFLETYYQHIRTMGLGEDQLENAAMKLFHLVLIGDAKEWLMAIPPQSFNTWTEVERAFLTRFFPPSKLINAKSKISAFKQGSDEEFHEAWERF